MNDETKEAIFEAVTSLLRDSDLPVMRRMRQAFLIRAHVARETGPNSAAATVVDMLAWLRAGQAAGDDLDNHAYGWAAVHHSTFTCNRQRHGLILDLQG